MPCLRLLLVHVARVEGRQGVGQGIREIFQFLIEILQVWILGTNMWNLWDVQKFKPQKGNKDLWYLMISCGIYMSQLKFHL